MLKRDKAQTLRFNQFVSFVYQVSDGYLFQISEKDVEINSLNHKISENVYLVRSFEKAGKNSYHAKLLKQETKSLIVMRDLLYQQQVEKKREDLFYQLLIEAEEDDDKQLKIIDDLSRKCHLNKKQVNYIFKRHELKPLISDIRYFLEECDGSNFEYSYYEILRQEVQEIYHIYPEPALRYEVFSFYEYQATLYEKLAKKRQYTLIVQEKQKQQRAYEQGSYYKTQFIDFDLMFSADFEPYVEWLEKLKSQTTFFLDLIDEDKNVELAEPNILSYVEKEIVDNDVYYFFVDNKDLIFGKDFSDYVNNQLKKMFETEPKFIDEVKKSLETSDSYFSEMFSEINHEIKFIGNYQDYNQIVDWVHDGF
ncbi:hypothetical protein RyT2_26550 [Pseudolactococcus yaeyamensis]